MLHGKRSSLPTSELAAIFNDDDDDKDSRRNDDEDSRRKTIMKSVDDPSSLPYSILAAIFNEGDDGDDGSRHRTRMNPVDDPCSPICQWFIRIGKFLHRGGSQ